jgi:hypothetical protein
LTPPAATVSTAVSVIVKFTAVVAAVARTGIEGVS